VRACCFASRLILLTTLYLLWPSTGAVYIYPHAATWRDADRRLAVAQPRAWMGAAFSRNALSAGGLGSAAASRLRRCRLLRGCIFACGSQRIEPAAAGVCWWPSHEHIRLFAGEQLLPVLLLIIVWTSA